MYYMNKMINLQRNIIDKLFKKLYIILNRLAFYREECFLNKIYNTYINNNKRTENIMTLKIDDSIKGAIGERELPNSKRFQKNGWYKKMLLRSGLAMHFSKGKDVLETCSGLGWGAYLLDCVARSVTCIDIEKEAINLSRKLWKTDKTAYIEGSVLKIPANDNIYDIVTAMESIEHFKLVDIRLYLSEMYRVLKPGGFLIGSSAFPDTKEQAKTLCSKYEYHLHICTKQAFKELLIEQGFKEIRIFQNRLFFMAKK